LSESGSLVHVTAAQTNKRTKDLHRLSAQTEACLAEHNELSGDVDILVMSRGKITSIIDSFTSVEVGSCAVNSFIEVFKNINTT